MSHHLKNTLIDIWSFFFSETYIHNTWRIVRSTETLNNDFA